MIVKREGVMRTKYATHAADFISGDPGGGDASDPVSAPGKHA